MTQEDAPADTPTISADTGRFCYFVPLDGYVEDHGYRVSIVFENEEGHRPSGNWPYSGKVGEVLPWFWGHDYEKACEMASKKNQEIGLSALEATIIVGRSMNLGPALR